MTKLTHVQRQQAIAIIRRHQQVESIRASLFDKQLSFLDDTCRYRATLCSRRSGKSYCAAAALIIESLVKDNSNNLYLALTRGAAKDIVWIPKLKALIHQHKIRAKFNESELTVTFDNGSRISIGGLDNSVKERDKLLGQAYDLVVIDESQAFHTNLKEAVLSMRPALADRQGSIIMIGTPDNVMTSFFMSVVTAAKDKATGVLVNPGWAVHRWTAFDNPHEPWQQEIDELKLADPGFELTPKFQRDYMGQAVVDDTNLVYAYDVNKNWIDARPKLAPGDFWTYAMGTDLGFDDACAFVVVCWNTTEPVLYVLDSTKHTGFDLTATSQEAYRLINLYQIKGSIVVDAHGGGAGKMGVEEMRKRHGLPWLAADKHDKPTFIRLLSADFRRARVKLVGVKCGALAKELSELSWDERALVDGKLQEDPRQDNHACDALLYVWRKAWHHLSKPKQVDSRSVEDKMFDLTVDHMKRTGGFDNEPDEDDKVPIDDVADDRFIRAVFGD